MNKTQRRVLDEAARKAQSFVDASNGDDEATCGSFRSLGVEPFTDEQRRAVRIYIESWVLEPLQLLQQSLDGDRSFTTQQLLESYAR